MARRQTLVQLTDEQVDALDALARRHGRSRSSLIRHAVDDLLAADERSLVGARIADAYRRVPQATPDAWGDPAGAADRSAAETMARLAAEEADAGHAPW